MHLICLVSLKQGNSIDVSASSWCIYHEDSLIFLFQMLSLLYIDHMILFYNLLLYIVLIVEGLMED